MPLVRSMNEGFRERDCARSQARCATQSPRLLGHPGSVLFGDVPRFCSLLEPMWPRKRVEAMRGQQFLGLASAPPPESVGHRLSPQRGCQGSRAASVGWASSGAMGSGMFGMSSGRPGWVPLSSKPMVTGAVGAKLSGSSQHPVIRPPASVLGAWI